jgi:hypothetical protein
MTAIGRAGRASEAVASLAVVSTSSAGPRIGHGIGPEHELDELARSVLEFERARSWPGRAKARAIREGLGITPTRYHQVLLGAIERPEALAFDPMLVRRLRRLRDARRTTRLARRLEPAQRSGGARLGLAAFRE